MDETRITPHEADTESEQTPWFRQVAAPLGPGEPGTEGTGAKDAASSGSNASSADLFALIWSGLADILGTAAAATLLRRAAQCALPRAPELVLLRITRQGLEYRYTLPSSWTSPVSDSSGALSALARELWPLLVDLTGSVVVQRLAQLPELRVLGVTPREEPEA